MEKILNYKFKDNALLDLALTHPSNHHNKKVGSNYERMEFLGDSVLGLIVSEYLYLNFPDESEGDLAKRRAGIVCGETLAQLAKKMGLGSHIVMSKGEEDSGGRENVKNLENTLEAVIAAIFLDGGMIKVREFFNANIRQLIHDMIEPPRDPKTVLQEFAQGKGKPIPEYTIIEQEGPPHSPVFTIQVKIDGYEPKTAKGTSKKEAEKEAAKKLVEQINA